MASIIINNIEYTEIEYIYQDETETQYGIYEHDLNDINHDGDCIYGNGCELPKTQEDAEIMMQNEFAQTCFHYDDDNDIYYVE